MANFISTKLTKIAPERWRWIFEHEGFKRYSANTGWMFFGQFFSLFLSFFIGVWIARYLGPENYGILSYTVAFVGLFGFIATLGVDGILNRELVKYPEKRDELLGTSFVLKIIGGFVAITIISITIFAIESTPLIKSLVLLYSFIFMFQSAGVISIYFQAKVEAKKNVLAQTLATTISSILKVVMILSGLGVIWLIAIYVLDALLIAIFLTISYYRSGQKIKNWKFDISLAKKIISGSWLLMLTAVSGSIYLRIDQIIIKELLDETAVGLYSAGTKLSEVWYFLPTIITASLFPAIINSRKTNKDQYFRRLKKLFSLMTFISISIALVITILAKPIITILFGESYIDSISVLKIYSWSTIAIFLNIALAKYLLAENYLTTIFTMTAVGAILNIILNIILIPTYGINGAAVATLFSYTAMPLSLILYKKIRKDLKQIIFIK